MGNEIWVCGRVWDIDLTIRLAGLSLSQYSQIPRPGVTDLVTTHLSFSGVAAQWTQCDPSCVCLTGDCDNHCIVSLVMIITNQSPQLRGVSPLLSCAWSPRHLLPWSRAPDSSSSYVIRWTQCCHNSDCLSFKSPVTARRVPTPRHILSVHTWYLPIVKLFTTPTREGFYKINSQPHDDLPGCRYSDTLILPQKEFWVGNDICVSREANIYDMKTNKFTSCRYPLTFKIETKFHCIKVTNAWDYSGRWLVIIYLQRCRSGPALLWTLALQCLQSYEANETHCRANDTCPIWYGGHLYCITALLRPAARPAVK